MLNNAILGILLLGGSILFSENGYAQTRGIDTIVVNLSNDDKTRPAKNTPEVTPVLDLGAMRDQAREDSIKIAQIQKVKDDAEKKRMEELKEKRLKEKEDKEKELKSLAEKRKMEKELRENELENKKKEKEIAEALQKKAERQAKEKEQLAEKEKKQKEDPARAEAKKVTKAEEKNKEQPNIDNTVKEETVMVEESESTNETETPIQEEVAKEDFETEINTTDTQEETEIAEIEPEQALIKETAEELDLPKVPKGVVQQDNNYGTVRLAYDENAASFLLSIPTETKMHYHKDHSEHIMLIEGEGMVLMGYKTVKLKKNELLFITQGTPHKIINSGKDKLKVLSIQSPFYDGSDIIILE